MDEKEKGRKNRNIKDYTGKTPEGEIREKNRKIESHIETIEKGINMVKGKGKEKRREEKGKGMAVAQPEPTGGGEMATQPGSSGSNPALAKLTKRKEVVAPENHGKRENERNVNFNELDETAALGSGKKEDP